MILEYKVENFCSFGEGFNFSMKPGKVISRFDDNVVKIKNNFKVSKLGVIVGENAGGKTSFMKSLDYFKYIIKDTNSEHVSSIKPLCNNYNVDIPQKFEMSLVGSDEKIYTYILIMDSYSIILEELYVRNLSYKKEENKMIFTMKRKKMNNLGDNMNLEFSIDVNLIPEKFKKILNDILDENEYSHKGVFLNYLYNLGLDSVKPFVDCINEKVIVEIPEKASINLYKTMERNEKDLSILKKESFFEIFSLVDSSIIKIEIDEENPFEKTIIVRRLGNGKDFKLEIAKDSSGVNEFFAWSIQIWKVIYEDGILFADEIDKVFNSILASKVVNYIKGSDHKGQFIFTTHNVLHMNTNDFMKEQIYFISKNSDTLESNLYSLADFPEYRYEKVNVYELYLKGLLGGVPNV